MCEFEQHGLSSHQNGVKSVYQTLRFPSEEEAISPKANIINILIMWFDETRDQVFGHGDHLE